MTMWMLSTQTPLPRLLTTAVVGLITENNEKVYLKGSREPDPLVSGQQPPPEHHVKEMIVMFGEL